MPPVAASCGPNKMMYPLCAMYVPKMREPQTSSGKGSGGQGGKESELCLRPLIAGKVSKAWADLPAWPQSEET